MEEHVDVSAAHYSLDMPDEVVPPRPAGPDPCPACGGGDVVHIQYGMHIPATMEGWEPWEVTGGCVIGPDSPTRRCNGCGRGWSPESPVIYVETTEAGRRPRRPSPMPKRRGPRLSPAPALPPSLQRGRLTSIRSLLRYADCADLAALEAWISDRTELSPFVYVYEGDELVVGFGRSGVGIEFPTTASEFWASVSELEDEVIAELEANDESESE